MTGVTTLHIQLARCAHRPPVGAKALNEVHGGPEALLGWIETQLGLLTEPVLISSRITEYAAALDCVSDGVFLRSLATDRWATAAELLSRRDELRLAGWDERDSALLPPLVRDLARAAGARTLVYLDEASRLENVLKGIEAGQTLPAHRCILLDPPDLWPREWQKVFQHLAIGESAETPGRAARGSSLQKAQSIALGQERQAVKLDDTLRCLATRSETAACEFIAAALSRNVEQLSETTVYCEDDALALRLDACLDRAGLPTMGAASQSVAHPILQVLPLSLSLCWEPVAPQVLLDFLALPVSPIPRTAAAKLARALAEQPGIGSSEWVAAVDSLCSSANDPQGKLRARLDSWLAPNRQPRGSSLPTQLVRQRCNLVAQWASGRATKMEESPNDEHLLVEALKVAAGQASLLGALAESQGPSLSEPQLNRLLEEVLSSGVRVLPFKEAWRGPVRVRSLAEISSTCRRLIWLGVGSGEGFACRWLKSELDELKRVGIDLDDGSRALSAIRSAEARGLARVQDSLLAVFLPRDSELRWHPLWLAIRNELPEEEREHPLVLEELLAHDAHEPIAPFAFETTEVPRLSVPKRGPLWNVPVAFLHDRPTVSASELYDRLACPLKWVLNYQARLKSSPIARLPSDFQLKGNFCHSVLERVFGGGGPLPSIKEALVRVADVFDERLPLDAAPLAQPDQVSERGRLRASLLNATRTLLSALQAGGYRIVGIEVEVSGQAFGKPLNGWIDCLAAREDGREAVIDFKYAGREKYRDLLESGRAVQLATYAHSRSQEGGTNGTYPAVAYLVLSDAQMFSPTGSQVLGSSRQSLVSGPDIQSVWQCFAQAVQEADGWLSGAQAVSARPLQGANDWPTGADLVLTAGLRANELQEVCRYCDYKRICGTEELA
jgi:ATP-dependent helicase/nuclease subunit B